MATPARSDGFGGATRKRRIGCWLCRTLFTTTNAVPEPTWQAAGGSPLGGGGDCRQAPLSIAALASRPAGRIIVKSFGESVAGLWLNLMSTPSESVAAACVPQPVQVWASATVGAIDADAD